MNHQRLHQKLVEYEGEKRFVYCDLCGHWLHECQDEREEFLFSLTPSPFMTKDLENKEARFFADSGICPGGKATIGHGRNIDERGGMGVSATESGLLMGNDLERIATKLSLAFLWWVALDNVRQEVLVSMAYQLGVDDLTDDHGYPNMLRAVGEGNFHTASVEMLTTRRRVKA